MMRTFALDVLCCAVQVAVDDSASSLDGPIRADRRRRRC